MGCNMCVVQKPEEQYKVMLQVGLPGRGGEGRGGVTWVTEMHYQKHILCLP